MARVRQIDEDLRYFADARSFWAAQEAFRAFAERRLRIVNAVGER